VYNCQLSEFEVILKEKEKKTINNGILTGKIFTKIPENKKVSSQVMSTMQAKLPNHNELNTHLQMCLTCP
jgi:hypothetical protein